MAISPCINRTVAWNSYTRTLLARDACYVPMATETVAIADHFDATRKASHLKHTTTLLENEYLCCYATRALRELCSKCSTACPQKMQLLLVNHSSNIATTTYDRSGSTCCA